MPSGALTWASQSGVRAAAPTQPENWAWLITGMLAPTKAAYG